jgi:hypothetical protein
MKWKFLISVDSASRKRSVSWLPRFPARGANKMQWILKQASEAQFTVHEAGRLVGRVERRSMPDGSHVWHWSLSGPHVPARLQPDHGLAVNFEAAKNALRLKYEAWCGLRYRRWSDEPGPT